MGVTRAAARNLGRPGTVHAYGRPGWDAGRANAAGNEGMMKGPANLLLAVVLGTLLLFFLLRPLLGLVFGLLHLATGLLYLAVAIAAVVFVVGLIRRLMRI